MTWKRSYHQVSLFLGRLEWQWANQPLDSDTFYTTACRLHIRVLHFYKGLSLTNDGCFSRLLATACTMIEYVETLGEKPGFYAATPLFIAVALALACCSLLRLLKSAISRDLDTERARSCLFKGINMLKTISVDRDDVTDKCATLLKQLWNSSKAFRKPDGTEHTTLRIRSRLTMSPLLDALWWWREEHDPSHKPVMPEGETVNGTALQHLHVFCPEKCSLTHEPGLQQIHIGIPMGSFPHKIRRQLLRSDPKFSRSSMTTSWPTSSGRWGMITCFPQPSRMGPCHGPPRRTGCRRCG